MANALQAIEFYRKAFGAELRSRAPGTEPGSTMHAEIRIADSPILLADQMDMGPLRTPAQLGAATASLNLYVPDVDAVFAQAVRSGATPLMAPEDMFWGDRWSSVKDPFGHIWGIATHKEDVSDAEIEKRSAEFLARMAAQSGKK